MQSRTRSQPQCESMMQEIAVASAESILMSLDAADSSAFGPETPPTKHSATEWFTPHSESNPFPAKPSWAFSEGDISTVMHSKSSSSLGGKQSGGSIYSNSDDGSAFGESGGYPPTAVSCTTVMLRNIPNKYTRSGLLSALIDRGFDPTVDCNNLYLPMDASSGCNLGYAFLNFTGHEKALRFMKQFDGCRLPSAGSRKVCSVVWANKQGVFQHSNPPTLKEPTLGAAAFDQLVNRVPTCKIFVGGLPVTTTESDIREYFSRYGSVKDVSIVINRQTGASRGFAFCEFTGADAVERVENAQTEKPHSINCRVISVRPYNSQHFIPEAAPQVSTPPQTMSFLMGNGLIQCPTISNHIASAYGNYGPNPSSYVHPLLASPMDTRMGPAYMTSPIHSFISY
jgi:hypothetical protein